MSVLSDAVQSQARKGHSPRFRLRVLVSIALIALTTLAVAAYLLVHARESTDDANLEAHVVYVAPRVAGQVEKLCVEENQHVKKGQLLVELDPEDYQVRVNQAQAQLRSAQHRQEVARVRAGVTQVASQASLHGARSNLEMGVSHVEKARIQVETAHRTHQAEVARLDTLRAQLREAQSHCEETRSQVRVAQVQLLKCRQDLQRARQLVAQEASPKELLDHSQAAYDEAQAQADALVSKLRSSEWGIKEAQANLQAAQELVRQSESQVAESQAHVQEVQAQSQDFASRVESASSAPEQVKAAQLEVRVAEAEVQAAQTALDKAQLELKYTKIVAPMEGRVSRRLVEPGSYVQVGQSLMAQVSENIWVVANFRETDLTHIRRGQAATIVVDAYPHHPLSAHVDSIQPGSGSRFALLPPENASGNWVKVVQRVPVKIHFDKAPPRDLNLEPGMSVRATVHAQ